MIAGASERNGSHGCGFFLCDFAVAPRVLRCGWEAHPLPNDGLIFDQRLPKLK
jgi:hypothetical protein